MSFSEKDMDLIDGYLKGHLNSTDKKIFEEKIRKDKEFAKSFHALKLAKEAIRRKALKKNFQSLQSLESSLPKIELEEEQHSVGGSKNGKKQSRIKRWLAIAAGLLLLLFAGQSIYNNGSTAAEVFAQEFEAYPNLENEQTRNILDSSAPGQKSLKDKAYSLYENKKYKAAIPIFKTLIAEKENPRDYFYLGVAYLANDNPNLAIETLNLLKDKKAEYTGRAYWYIALAHLKNNEVEKAKTILNDMQKIPNAGSYLEKAKRVLDEL